MNLFVHVVGQQASNFRCVRCMSLRGSLGDRGNLRHGMHRLPQSPRLLRNDTLIYATTPRSKYLLRIELRISYFVRWRHC